ncbi:MAG: hypothetical protein MRK02_06830 [Candidatus Scalindua sp.]|nr:hypothetical protein [Candidatus Scalindua sp.]
MIKIFFNSIGITLFISALITVSFADTAYEFNENGVRYMNSQDYEMAVKSFKEAYAQSPENETIKKNLSHSYAALANENAKRGEWEKAITTIEKAHELDSGNHVFKQRLSIFYNNFAYEQMQEGLSDSANHNLKLAIQYDKDNWAAYVSLGRLMYNQGKIKEAAEYWAEAVSLHPELSEIKQRLEIIRNEINIQDTFQKKQLLYFDVKYEGYEKNNLAWKVVEILREAYTNLGHDFKYYPRQKIPVIIYTKEQFQQITNTPDWIGGLYDGIIRIAASTIEGNNRQLENILYHEYTHALLHQKTGNKLPLWLNEGLAQNMEPNKNTKNRNEIIYLKKCLDEESFISLPDLNNALQHRENKEQLNLAYLEAKYLVDYLNTMYYFYRIVFILDELTSGKNIENAIKETIFTDINDLEKNWLQWLSSK